MSRAANNIKIVDESPDFGDIGLRYFGEVGLRYFGEVGLRYFGEVELRWGVMIRRRGAA